MATLLSRHAPLTGEERAYVVSRVVLNLAFAAPFVLGHAGWVTLTEERSYAVATLVFSLGTLAMTVAVHGMHQKLSSVMMWLLPADAYVFAVSTFINRGEGDAVYPIMVASVVLYALVQRRVGALLAAAVFGAAYVAAVTFAAPAWWANFAPMMLTVKVVTLVIVALVINSAVTRLLQREMEIEAVIADREALNQQLARRLDELQAVSEMTEVIHASLDADVVGPRVVEILSKVIGVDSCSLFVVNKKTGETVFEAGHGGVGPVGAFAIPTGGDEAPRRYVADFAESPFSCLAVHDHDDVTVVFCADSSDVEMLTEEDRLVLGAVAAELVVAIENSQLYQLTRRLAVTDELTGLYNRRFLRERLEEEAVRARRYGGSLSLLMLDCDNFKSYNDSNGHLAGDMALMELADVLRAAVREVDVAARYGGEEFCILLPATDESGAFVVAEKVREAIAMHPFGPSGAQLTVSIGVATLPTHATDEEALQQAADDALYDAKNGGKNRVRVPGRTVDGTQAQGVDR